MADLKQCDGCGKISPDKNAIPGPHIANHWTHMKTSHGHKDRGVGRIDRLWHERIFCEDCISEIEAVITSLERNKEDG